MDTQAVIDYFGGPRKTARALGLRSHGAVVAWRTSGIPGPRQAQIERLTEGRFRAAIEPWQTQGGGRG